MNDRRLSAADAAGFDPVEADLWSGEDWGGLFLTVDITKTVQDRMTALRREAAKAITDAMVDPDEVDDGDQGEDVERAVGLIADLFGILLVPAPGYKRKRAEAVIRHAYEHDLIGLTALRTFFQQLIDASRPT